MQPILFRFGVYLMNPLRYGDPRDITERREVAFHRWFPDGEADALVLDTGYSKATLRVWFERKNVSDGTLTGPEEERLVQVGSEAFTEYGVLWSGPLHGELKVQGGLSPEQIAALEKSSKEVIPEHYEIAKQVVKYWLGPPIAAFVRVLRFRFGQYWLEEFEEWDSNRVSFSQYCNNTLHLKVSTDGGQSFRQLSLGDFRINVTASFSGVEFFKRFISKGDWQEIPNLAKRLKEPSVALRLVSRAHELAEIGGVKHALIEAITALEIAIEQRLRENLRGSQSAWDKAAAFLGEKTGQRGVSLQAQVAVVGALLENIPVDLIQQVLEAIELRNGIIHDGVEAPEDARKLVFAVLTFTIRTLREEYRFASKNVGNRMMSKERWDTNDHAEG